MISVFFLVTSCFIGCQQEEIDYENTHNIQSYSKKGLSLATVDRFPYNVHRSFCFLGSLFDGNKFDKDWRNFKPLFFVDYGNPIDIYTLPPIGPSAHIKRQSSATLNYVKEIQNKSFDPKLTKTNILIIQLNTQDDFIREGFSYSSYQEGAVLLEFTKPIYSINVRPINIEDESIKLRILNKTHNPLYISSLTVGHKAAILFHVNKDQVKNISEEINNFIQNTLLGRDDIALPLLKKNLISVGMYEVSNEYIRFFMDPEGLLRKMTKLAQEESLFPPNAGSQYINYKIKNAIENTPY